VLLTCCASFSTASGLNSVSVGSTALDTALSSAIRVRSLWRSARSSRTIVMTTPIATPTSEDSSPAITRAQVIGREISE